MIGRIDRFMKFFGFVRETPLHDEIASLKEVIQDLTTEKLIAEDRLRSALDDKQQLWGLMSTSIQDMKVAYQMHINIQWQRQGLPAPYPEAPGIPPERQTAYEAPKDPVIPRPQIPSEIIAQYKRQIASSLLSGDTILR
jgi:hypothetical protein